MVLNHSTSKANNATHFMFFIKPYLFILVSAVSLSSPSLLLSELVLESSLSASLGESLPSMPRDRYSINVHSLSWVSGSILMGMSGQETLALLEGEVSGSEMTVFSSTALLSGQPSGLI